MHEANVSTLFMQYLFRQYSNLHFCNANVLNKIRYTILRNMRTNNFYPEGSFIIKCYYKLKSRLLKFLVLVYKKRGKTAFHPSVIDCQVLASPLSMSGLTGYLLKTQECQCRSLFIHYIPGGGKDVLLHVFQSQERDPTLLLFLRFPPFLTL